MPPTPKSATLRFRSECSLGCPRCDRKFPSGGFLTLENFKRFVDRSPGLTHINIPSCSDTFLNPDFIKIVEWGLRERGLLFNAYDINLAQAGREALDALAPALGFLSVVSAGATAETYAKARPGGDFERLIENLAYIRQRTGANVQWIYQITRNSCSLDEIAHAKELAKSKGLGLFFTKDNSTWSPANPRELYAATGVLWQDAQMFEPYIGYSPKACAEGIAVPNIDWDGGILGCQHSTKYKNFGGAALKLGAGKSMKTKPYRDIRHALMTGKAKCGSQCFDCWLYRKILWNGQWATREDFDGPA